ADLHNGAGHQAAAESRAEHDGADRIALFLANCTITKPEGLQAPFRLFVCSHAPRSAANRRAGTPGANPLTGGAAPPGTAAIRLPPSSHQAWRLNCCCAPPRSTYPLPSDNTTAFRAASSRTGGLARP